MQNTRSDRKFRFRLGLTLAVLPVFTLLLVLGTWQVRRHFWKQALLASLNTPAGVTTCGIADLMALDVASEQTSENAGCDVYELTATINPETIFYMGSDRIAGISGRYAMALAEVSTTGQPSPIGLWVRLGFVPQNKYAAFPDSVIRQINDREMQTEAFLGKLQSAGWQGATALKPQNDPERALWAYVDTTQLDQHFAVESNNSANTYIHIVTGPVIDGLTYFTPASRLSNNHWHYSLTWYSLAVILAAIWFLMSREPWQNATRRNV